MFKIDNPWTHAEEQKLIELWRAGEKGGIIAAALGRSRSTILGKVHRMRKYGLLEYRDEPLRKAAEAARKLQKEQLRAKASRGGVRVIKFNPPRIWQEPIVAPDKAPEVPFDPNKNYPKITELKNSMCKHVMTDDTSVNALYCGDPVHRLSFCKAHHARFYHRVATKRKSLI